MKVFLLIIVTLFALIRAGKIPETSDEELDEFEMLETGAMGDETQNAFFKDECQQNRALCQRYVARERAKGEEVKVHVGSDGQPVIDLPLFEIYEVELKIADGNDAPEDDPEDDSEDNLELEDDSEAGDL